MDMLIKIKVFPESKNEEIKQVKPDKLEVYLRASPRRGEANMRLLELLSQRYEGAQFIRIIKGQTTPNKIVEIKEPTRTLLTYESEI